MTEQNNNQTELNFNSAPNTPEPTPEVEKQPIVSEPPVSSATVEENTPKGTSIPPVKEEATPQANPEPSVLNFAESTQPVAPTGYPVAPAQPAQNYQVPPTQPNPTYPQMQGQPIQNPSYNSDFEFNYDKISKQFFYCHLFPILFFVPMLPENKELPCAKEFGNTLFWIFIINLVQGILSSTLVFIPVLGKIVSLFTGALWIFNLTMFFKALSGKPVKIPAFRKGIYK